MKASILHESKGRIRFLVCKSSMTLHEADLLENWFQKKEWTKQVTVHERTRCVILQYRGSRQNMIEAIRTFTWEQAEKTVLLPMHSSRELNRNFQEKLMGKLIVKAASVLFLPKPLRILRILCHMIFATMSSDELKKLSMKSTFDSSVSNIYSHFLPCVLRVDEI